jgi:hypothetical protein
MSKTIDLNGPAKAYQQIAPRFEKLRDAYQKKRDELEAQIEQLRKQKEAHYEENRNSESAMRAERNKALNQVLSLIEPDSRAIGDELTIERDGRQRRYRMERNGARRKVWFEHKPGVGFVGPDSTDDAIRDLHHCLGEAPYGKAWITPVPGNG